MPVALAPSSIFPTARSQPMTTESRSRFVDYQAGGLPSARAYRATKAPEVAQVFSQPTSLVSQLSSLTARLEALAQPPCVPAPPPADAAIPRVAQLEGSRLSGSNEKLPWEGSTYDTFAKYAGEASRVANTGRLAFGSDTKKMQI